VEICNQRANITASIRSASRLVRNFHPINNVLNFFGPVVVISLVDRVAFGTSRELHVLVGENELANAGIVGESVNTLAGGVYEHARGTIENVSSSGLGQTRVSNG
jgi:hypothetical protein